MTQPAEYKIANARYEVRSAKYKDACGDGPGRCDLQTGIQNTVLLPLVFLRHTYARACVRACVRVFIVNEEYSCENAKKDAKMRDVGL